MDRVGEPLFKNPRFLKLWTGQGISFVGDAVSMVALVILIVQITGHASSVGGLLVARLVPTLASPLVGVLADRFDRRLILVGTDLMRAVLIVAVIFTRDLAVIYALVFLMGIARTFFNPTIRAAFPSVVGNGDLTRANALISGTFSVSVMVGPALGGLVASFDLNVAFLLDAATYVLSALLLSQISLPRPDVEEEEGGGFVHELRAGFGYLAGARVPLGIVVGALLTILTINLMVPAEIFLAKQTFGTGNAGYGLLVSLWGVGMILGTALIAALGDRLNLLLFYFMGIFVAALALVATSLSPTFVLALAALTVAGISNGIDNVATDTILQKRVPDAFLGRVFSVRFLTYSAGEAIAYPVGGLVVDAVGPRSTYLLSGLATAAAGTLILFLITVPLRRTKKNGKLLD